MVMFLAVIGNLACTGTDVTTTESDTATVVAEDTNPFLQSTGPDQPDDDVDETLAKLATRLSSGLPTPVDIRHTYRRLMEGRDSSCPTFESQESDTWTGVWESDCDSLTGFHYYGTAIYAEFEEVEDDATTLDILMLSSYEITDADGQAFVGGGVMGLARDTAGDEITLFVQIGGTYSYAGTPGWMSVGADTSLFVLGEMQDGVGEFQVDGGVGYPDLDLAFDGMQLARGECEQVPTGTIALRDSSGYWLRIEFADCDPCGQMTFNGNDMGEACVGEAVAQAGQAMLDDLLSVTLED
jgi:hypothetical protein